MTWEFFLIISITAEVFGRLLQRTLLNKEASDPIAYAVVFQLLAGTFIGIYALIIGFRIPDLAPILPNFLFMTVIWSIVNILIFRSLKLTEASIFMILFSTRAIWLIVGAIIFLGESFSALQILGTLFILTSVILVSGRRENFKVKKGEIFALGAALSFAAAVLNDSYIVRNFDVPSFLTFGMIIPSVLTWAVHPHKTKEIVSLITHKDVWKIAILSLAFGTTAVTGLLAYQVGSNAAQLGALFQVSSILTVLLAIFVLKEKTALKIKIIAGVISFIGVLLVV